MGMLRIARKLLDDLFHVLANHPPELITLAGPLGQPLYWMSTEGMLDRMQWPGSPRPDRELG